MSRSTVETLRLETARLVLRPPRLEDFDGYAAFMADPRAAKFVGGVQPRSTAWRSFMTLAGAWYLQGFSMFSVIDVLGWDDVIHVIEGTNTASQSVARKLGARNRGPGKLPPPYENAAVDIWGQTRAEWLARRHSAAAAR